MAFCGALTHTGAQCRARVPSDGSKCHWHKPAPGTDPTCSVCMDHMLERNCRELPCGHTFHKKCLQKWKLEGNRTCPLCREEFDHPQFRITVNIESLSNTYNSHSFDATQNVDILFESLNIEPTDIQGYSTQLMMETEDINTLRSVLERIGIDLNNSDIDALITRDTE